MTDDDLARAIAAIAKELAKLQGDIRLLQQSQTRSQLGRSSIDDGTLTVLSSGTVRQTIGVQPDGTVTTVDQNAPAPPVPSNPTVTPAPAGLTIAWDGTFSGGAAQPLDFNDVEVHLSMTLGFTPSAATLRGVLPKAGQITIQPLSSSTTYYIGLVAVNTSSNKSTVSTEVSGVPQGTLTSPVTATEIGNIGVLNANPYFTGGDGTGWASGGELPGPGIVIANLSSVPPFANTQPSTSKTVGGSAVSRLVRAPVQQPSMPPSGAPVVVSLAGSGSIGTPGTVSVVTTQPTGSPYTYALQFVSNTLGGGTAQEAGPPAFPVVPGQQYLVTGLFYTPGTSVSLGLSFFMNGVWTTDVAGMAPVSANTWTQVTSVVTAPSGANSAGPVFFTPGQGGQYTMYGQAVLVLPQVPGALIQAGTITATQIAAGIVVAGIINGTVVEAATFIVDASGAGEGQFFYSPTPTTGNLIGSWAAKSGTDFYNNPYPAGLYLVNTLSTGSLTILPVNGTATSPLLELDSGRGISTPGLLFTTGFGAIVPFDYMIAQSPVTTADTERSYVQLQLAGGDPGTPGSASGIFIWERQDTGHITVAGQWDEGGFHIYSGDITAVQPGTTNPVTPETWHFATLTGGWTGSGNGVNGLAYRKTAENELQIVADLLVPASPGTIFTFPSGYIPSTSQNIPCGSYSATTSPHALISGTGVLTATQLGGTGTALVINARIPLGPV